MVFKNTLHTKYLSDHFVVNGSTLKL